MILKTRNLGDLGNNFLAFPFWAIFGEMTFFVANKTPIMFDKSFLSSKKPLLRLSELRIRELRFKPIFWIE